MIEPMSSELTIRPEQPDDFDAIHQLVRDAFGRDVEAVVVRKLRASAAYVPQLALVAIENGAVVGHIMITTLDYESDAGKRVGTTILAPLAVRPDRQKRGVGSLLSREALGCARAAGFRSMILVGHPTYYPRFGFRPASTWWIRYATPIPDEVFMAMELVPGALADAAGIIHLPPAFDEA